MAVLLVGKSALVTDDISACFGAFMMRFRSNEDYRYTYNLLTAAITQYKQLFSTSTINQLTIGIFLDWQCHLLETKKSNNK